MLFDVKRFLTHAIQENITDIHFRAGLPPIVRRNGAIEKVLDERSKLGILGDKKVAAAYVDATSDSFSKLDTPYDSALPALEKYKAAYFILNI